MGHDVLVIDDDPVVIRRLRDAEIPCLRGDASDLNLLRRAGADRARIITSTIRRPKDDRRMLEFAGGVPVLVRVFEESDAKWITELGGTPVMASHAAAAEMMKWFDREFSPSRACRGARSGRRRRGSAGRAHAVAGRGRGVDRGGAQGHSAEHAERTSGRLRDQGPAPTDSFTARLTMPRSGTFMYHTHLNDVEQLTAGLYGAIIVQEPRVPFDPANDHVYVAGWDGTADPRLLINGDSVLAPMTWRPGRAHRLRFINIGPAERLSAALTLASDTMAWRPIAKDGADLPPQQSAATAATFRMDVGETVDFEFTPVTRGEYVLSLKHVPSKFTIEQRITVR
jgi:hypothetical protein